MIKPALKLLCLSLSEPTSTPPVFPSCKTFPIQSCTPACHKHGHLHKFCPFPLLLQPKLHPPNSHLSLVPINLTFLPNNPNIHHLCSFAVGLLHMPFSATHENHVGILKGILPTMSVFFSFTLSISFFHQCLYFPTHMFHS